MDGSKRVSSVREKALDSLLEIMEKDLFCDKVMHTVLKESTWDKRDRSLYKRLVSGTVERAIELDHILDQFSKLRTEKMKPVIRNILRMSLYQIFYMEKIPDAAVCNEAVMLAEKRKLYRLKGFVNGVLRNILRNREKISVPKEHRLSICYSMPEWLVKRWTLQYGEKATEEILKEFLSEKGSVTVRVLQGKEEACMEEWKEEGVFFEKGILSTDAYRISGFSRLEDLTAFQKGYFFVQDESSMLPAKLAGVKKGDLVIDLCAAPGGKAMHVADLLQGTGKVIAQDLTEEKIALIKENIKRLQIKNVETVKNDARIFRKEWEEQADIVIADLPCSGLGVIGKKCDIKYKTKEQDIPVLSKLQKEILQTAVRYIKKGGRLVFSTCTIAKEENEDNVAWMEKNLPLQRISIEEKLPAILQGRTGEDGYIQVMPNETGTDGFFVSVLEKNKDQC